MSENNFHGTTASNNIENFAHKLVPEYREENAGLDPRTSFGSGFATNR
jgi:hypothetical protein